MARKYKISKSTKAPTTDEDGWEVLGGSDQIPEVGEVIQGVFGGVTRYMEAKRKGQPPVPFYRIGDRNLLGGAILKNRIEEGGAQPGDELEVTRLEDLPAKKGQSPAKDWKVRIRRITSKGFVPKPRELGASTPKSKRRA